MKPQMFKPDHRLAWLIRRPGGIPIERAVARATKLVAEVEKECLGALDEKINALAEAAKQAPTATVYAYASEIFSLAATFGQRELADAARSLSTLVANRREGQETHGAREFHASVQVHIDALRTLRRPELSADAAARAEVVQGLRRVAAKERK